VPFPLSEVSIAAAWINNHGRDDFQRFVRRFERPLWLSQGWNLYAMKGEAWRRIDVRVDGEVVYRAPGHEYDWMKRTFRNRRIALGLDRAGKKPSEYTDNLVRFIVRSARRDFVGARTVEVIWAWDRYPGRHPKPFLHYTAEAPTWKVQHTRYR